MKLELRHGFDFQFNDHKKASGFWNLVRKSVNDSIDFKQDQFDHNSSDCADHYYFSLPDIIDKYLTAVIVLGLRGIVIKSDQ